MEAVTSWVQEIKVLIKQEEEREEKEDEDEIEAIDDWGGWDDVKGGELKTKEVKMARKEEVTYMKGRRIWDERPIEECVKRTGKKPITVRWVDTNKGTKEEQEIRSRLVARDVKAKDGNRDDLFASTPPLEGLRMLCSKAVSPSRKRRRDRRKILLMDARKTHLNPLVEGDVYIQLPEEAGAAEGMCGKLAHWIYGMRPAAQAWEVRWEDGGSRVQEAKGKCIDVLP